MLYEILDSVIAKKNQTIKYKWNGIFYPEEKFAPQGRYNIYIYTGDLDNHSAEAITYAVYPEEGYLGDYYVKIRDMELIVNYNGEPSMRVYFEFYNESDISYQCDWELHVNAYQNRKSIYTTIANQKVKEDDNGVVWINPGESIVYSKVFELHGNTPVTIEVFGDETFPTPLPKLQKIFSLQ